MSDKNRHLTVVPDLPTEPAPAPKATPEPKEPKHPIDPRAVEFLRGVPSMAKLRLFTALQGLSMPKGMLLTRGATRSFCANIVTEMTGLPANGRQKARPPRGADLEAMMSWLIADAERKGYEVQIIPQILPADQRESR